MAIAYVVGTHYFNKIIIVVFIALAYFIGFWNALVLFVLCFLSLVLFGLTFISIIERDALTRRNYILILRSFDGTGFADHGSFSIDDLPIPWPQEMKFSPAVSFVNNEYKYSHISDLMEYFVHYPLVLLTTEYDKSIVTRKGAFATNSKLKNLHRIYLKEANDWKTAFQILAEDAVKIVLFPSETEGIKEELNDLKNRGVNNCYLFLRQKMTKQTVEGEFLQILMGEGKNWSYPPIGSSTEPYRDYGYESLTNTLSNRGIDLPDANGPMLGHLDVNSGGIIQWIEANSDYSKWRSEYSASNDSSFFTRDPEMVYLSLYSQNKYFESPLGGSLKKSIEKLRMSKIVFQIKNGI
ncbi:MAG: hypothetical protein AAF992_02285, partial [Bacteroidota bacterium]